MIHLFIMIIKYFLYYTDVRIEKIKINCIGQRSECYIQDNENLMLE